MLDFYVEVFVLGKLQLATLLANFSIWNSIDFIVVLKSKGIVCVYCTNKMYLHYFKWGIHHIVHILWHIFFFTFTYIPLLIKYECKRIRSYWYNLICMLGLRLGDPFYFIHFYSGIQCLEKVLVKLKKNTQSKWIDHQKTTPKNSNGNAAKKLYLSGFSYKFV